MQKVIRLLLSVVAGSICGILLTVLCILVLFFADVFDIRESNVLIKPLLGGCLGGSLIGLAIALLNKNENTSISQNQGFVDSPGVWPPPPDKHD